MPNFKKKLSIGFMGSFSFSNLIHDPVDDTEEVESVAEGEPWGSENGEVEPPTEGEIWESENEEVEPATEREIRESKNVEENKKEEL
jgi:hypothetical protein